jgi:hypothetical protein
MTDEEEQALLAAKFAEARTWPEDWVCDGLYDSDQFATRILSFTRGEFDNTDKFPVIVEIEFYDPSQLGYLVHFDAREHFEVPDRDAAISRRAHRQLGSRRFATRAVPVTKAASRIAQSADGPLR